MCVLRVRMNACFLLFFFVVLGWSDTCRGEESVGTVHSKAVDHKAFIVSHFRSFFVFPRHVASLSLSRSLFSRFTMRTSVQLWSTVFPRPAAGGWASTVSPCSSPTRWVLCVIVRHESTIIARIVHKSTCALKFRRSD